MDSTPKFQARLGCMQHMHVCTGCQHPADFSALPIQQQSYDEYNMARARRDGAPDSQIHSSSQESGPLRLQHALRSLLSTWARLRAQMRRSCAPARTHAA